MSVIILGKPYHLPRAGNLLYVLQQQPSSLRSLCCLLPFFDYCFFSDKKAVGGAEAQGNPSLSFLLSGGKEVIDFEVVKVNMSLPEPIAKQYQHQKVLRIRIP